MRSEPGDAAEHDDDERRNRPDDQLEMAGELPLRPIEGARVGGPEPEGEAGDQHDDRQDDRQHDRQRIDQNEPLRGADRPGRIENAVAAGERRGGERGRRTRRNRRGSGFALASRTVFRQSARKAVEAWQPLRMFTVSAIMLSMSISACAAVHAKSALLGRIDAINVTELRQSAAAPYSRRGHDMPLVASGTRARADGAGRTAVAGVRRRLSPARESRCPELLRALRQA